MTTDPGLVVTIVSGGPNDMKKIGVREFRDSATKFIAGGAPLQIERHGHPAGYFVPHTDAEGKPALVHLAVLLRKEIDESTLSQDELIQLIYEARLAMEAE